MAIRSFTIIPNVSLILRRLIMATTNKVTFGEQLRTLENGIKANFTAVTSVIIGGVTYAIADLTTKIESFLTAQADTAAAQSAYHQAVTAEKASDAAARVFRSQVQAYAVSRYGKTNPILTQLSFTPAKAKKTTAAIKAVAVLKVKATRAARHTMGKKQKKVIKGSVDRRRFPGEPSGEPVEIHVRAVRHGTRRHAPTIPFHALFPQPSRLDSGGSQPCNSGCVGRPK
jgi:hypothetical protein